MTTDIPETTDPIDVPDEAVAITLTPAEVANVLRVAPATVRRWCEDGTMPCARIGGRWRIDAAELDVWLAEHTKTSRPRGQDYTEGRTNKL